MAVDRELGVLSMELGVAPPPPASLNPGYPVITEDLILKCVLAERKALAMTGDRGAEDLLEEPVVLHKLQDLRLSYLKLRSIDNLVPLDNLRVLRLDNNRFTKIENLSHLVNLEWLDLSFNEITVIEGLDTLTKLTDLVLSNNAIATVQGLDTLTKLESLSLGNNAISNSDALLYLRKMNSLRSVTLAGNPVCDQVDYRSNVLTYLPQVMYLDYETVNEEERASAVEQNPGTTELKEEDAARKLALESAAEAKERAARLHDANLEQVAGLEEAMFQDDEDGVRLLVFSEVSDLQSAYKERLQTMILEAVQATFKSKDRNHEEVQDVSTALAALRERSDKEARELVAVANKRLKNIHVATERDDAPDAREMRRLAAMFKEEVAALKESLMEQEMNLNEQCSGIINDFELNYTELQQKRADLFNKFFRAAEKAEQEYKDQISAYLQSLLEKAASSADGDVANPDLDMLDEDARAMLTDKEALMGILSSSHDAHIAKLLACEDQTRAVDKERAAAVVADFAAAEGKRNRERVSEIVALQKHLVGEVDKLVADVLDEEG